MFPGVNIQVTYSSSIYCSFQLNRRYQALLLLMCISLSFPEKTLFCSYLAFLGFQKGRLHRIYSPNGIPAVEFSDFYANKELITKLLLCNLRHNVIGCCKRTGQV